MNKKKRLVAADEGKKLSWGFLSEGVSSNQHQPVLVEEVMDALVVKKEGVYVDATFGCGGHSKEILRRIGSQGVLIGIDKDHAAIKIAKGLNDRRVVVRQGSFTRLKTWVGELNYQGRVNGILLDLGVSSPQLDNPDRGFSFLRDGPLDMRMDQGQSLNAAVWLNHAKESEIMRVLREYGEERFSRRIARAIVEQRLAEPITTTGRLAEIVSQAHPKWELRKHPATRVFQAIRILINNELLELANCLEQCLELLVVGGRLVVISFHSLEDRIVKNFIQKHSGGMVPEWLPLDQIQLLVRIKRVGAVIHPGKEELSNNPRSRSALLRVVEKIK